MVRRPAALEQLSAADQFWFPRSTCRREPSMCPTLDGFESVERRNADSSVVAEERVRVVRPVVPFTEDGARALGRRYWREVVRASRGLVRCRETGARVELTVLGRGPALLRFGGAEVAVGDDAVSCTYRIRGGILSLGERGALVLSQTGRRDTELRVVVDGFFARLGGGAVYGVQRRVHLAVSRRYFRHLLGDLAR